MKRILTALLGLSLLMTSCEDYLEGEVRGTVSTLDKITIEQMSASLFDQMVSTSNEISNDGCYGFPAIMQCLDNGSGDVLGHPLDMNILDECLDFTHTDADGYMNLGNWIQLYSYIHTCDNMVQGYEEDMDDKGRFHLAQAYVMRGYLYFTLIQMYQRNGAYASQGVPITKSEGYLNYNASCGEVYEYILENLDKAQELLDGNAYARPSKVYVDQSVLYAIRGRVYLVRKEYASALEYYTKAIQTTDASIMEGNALTRPGFIDMSSYNWMWALSIPKDHAITMYTYNWFSMYSSLGYGVCNYNDGYAINKNLFDQISETDVRKGMWLDEEGWSPNLTDEELNYMNEYAMYPPYTNVKFGTIGNATGANDWCGDIPLLRYEELVLSYAECLLMTGDRTGALETLTSFGLRRDEEYDFHPQDENDILDEIKRQRKIELWGEGVAFFDIMRYGDGIDLNGSGVDEMYEQYIPYDDPRMVYQIPTFETSNIK